MEHHHREAIQKNYSTLVQECRINDLLPALLKKHVFSKQMIKKYKEIPDELKRKRELFLDIQTRGPQAFNNLVTSLNETGQSHLATRLDPTAASHASTRRQAHPFILPTNIEGTGFDPLEIQTLAQNTNNNISVTTEPLKVKVQYSTKFYDEDADVPTYSTHSKKRGAVLIINIIKYINDLQPERKGADVDSRNLTDLFLQMGFSVESHIDLTKNDIVDVVREFKSSPNIVGCDMVFVIVMGHGETEKCSDVAEVIGTDNETVSTRWIEEQFNNINCKALQNKPKIFMYQMCRGKIPDYGTVQDTIEMDSGVMSRASTMMILRSCSDMLIAHSTIPGTASHRDVYLGSWYMNIFCKIMMKRAHNTHLENIFKILDNKLARLRSARQTIQTSMFTNIGFQTCYVHPGIYLDGNEIKSIHDNSLPENNVDMEETS
ncbi:hypothetical protein RN001_011891 [Aquatica leii]|uniref:Caspase Dronc n=1 Tax=Aquatica leii TaxID=1421715 RepID=A0AAN7P284_9COLE|nr:hypothetical protein RN001_011891 [Aquatica leii]